MKEEVCADAVAVLEVIEAARRSSAEGRVTPFAGGL
jgi:hypothetical protein